MLRYVRDLPEGFRGSNELSSLTTGAYCLQIAVGACTVTNVTLLSS